MAHNLELAYINFLFNCGGHSDHDIETSYIGAILPQTSKSSVAKILPFEEDEGDITTLLMIGYTGAQNLSWRPLCKFRKNKERWEVKSSRSFSIARRSYGNHTIRVFKNFYLFTLFWTILFLQIHISCAVYSMSINLKHIFEKPRCPLQASLSFLSSNEKLRPWWGPNPAQPSFSGKPNTSQACFEIDL